MTEVSLGYYPGLVDSRRREGHLRAVLRIENQA